MHGKHSGHMHHYMHLGIMAVLSFIAMYVLMYTMVDRFGNVYNNLNQVWMAGLMAAPMVIIELLVMRSMYPDTRLNMILIAVSAVLLIAFFVAIRQQVLIDDGQFLRSMIPHHAGAVLMCEKAAVADAEIRSLCEQIIKSQQDEIAQMRTILERLK